MIAVLLLTCSKVALYDVEITRIVDGDTFACRISAPLPEFGITVVIEEDACRVSNLDAWETSRRRQSVGEISTSEVEKGKRAVEEFRQLLPSKRWQVSLQTPRRDVYGRLLVRLYFDGTDYGEYMRTKGYDRREK